MFIHNIKHCHELAMPLIAFYLNSVRMGKHPMQGGQPEAEHGCLSEAPSWYRQLISLHRLQLHVDAV